MGIFGDMFDFNKDGELDCLEKALEFSAFMNVIEAEKKDELVSAGLDPDELESMDSYERRRAISDAGLDPDDYEL